tara:strand:+ start:1566 stop:1763 length:198 start_codon:yes stop_codon:yes gene_type:complete
MTFTEEKQLKDKEILGKLTQTLLTYHLKNDFINFKYHPFDSEEKTKIAAEDITMLAKYILNEINR